MWRVPCVLHTLCVRRPVRIPGFDLLLKENNTLKEGVFFIVWNMTSYRMWHTEYGMDTFIFHLQNYFTFNGIILFLQYYADSEIRKAHLSNNQSAWGSPHILVPCLWWWWWRWSGWSLIMTLCSHQWGTEVTRSHLEPVMRWWPR